MACLARGTRSSVYRVSRSSDERVDPAREPTTPGEILREEFLIPLGMTQKELADHPSAPNRSKTLEPGRT